MFFKSVFAFVLATLAACATGPAEENLTREMARVAAGVAAYSAAEELISRAEDPQARAQRIVLYTEIPLRMLQAADPVSVERLYDALYAEIDWTFIPTEDHFWVTELLHLVKAHVEARLGDLDLLDTRVELYTEYILRRVQAAAEVRS